MASSSSTQVNSETGKLPFIPLLGAIIFGTILSVGAVTGAIYYFIHSGRLLLSGNGTSKVDPVTIATYTVVLEPLLVNLADVGGNSYLRVGLTLRVSDKTEVKAKKNAEGGTAPDKAAEAALRDTTITVLGRQTAEELMSPDGKENLKTQLKNEFLKDNPDTKVMDIYFTEFLVQR